MLFLYDDTAPTPPPIRQIIRVERFADVLRRKRRLGDVLEEIVAGQKEQQFVRISDPAGRAEQIERLERRASDALVFRLPSSLAPTDLDKFARTVRKLPYALEPAVFGGRFDDEAVALMRPEGALALLKMEDPAERRAFFNNLAGDGARVDNAMGLIDLREVSNFLRYMSGATEARHFNSTRITGGVFRKFSTDKGKMRAEHQYFHVVPEPMRRFLLPTFDYEENDAGAGYAMENLLVPDAAIQIVHDSFDPASFGRLMDRFFDFLGSRALRPAGVEAVRDVARREILGKIDRRLAQLLGTEVGQRLDALLTASGPYGGVAAMQARAGALIEAAIAADRSDALAVSHGDPCLSNILFNREIGLFRLIDPRGAVTLEDALMHPLYDVAKFSHSVLGGYDFVNNGLFECQLDDRLQLTLSLQGGGPPPWMRTAFLARLAEAGFNARIVRAYELSLFMSMLPLHTDVPRKLPGFCITACNIMRELEDGVDPKGKSAGR